MFLEMLQCFQRQGLKFHLHEAVLLNKAKAYFVRSSQILQKRYVST